MEESGLVGKLGIVVGTRQSPLAVTQALIVIDMIRRRQGKNSSFDLKIKKIQSGETRVSKSSSSVDYSRKDLFTGAIDDALKNGTIDVAIHSLKDVPSEISEGIEIISFPKRASPLDVLVARKGIPPSLGRLPKKAKVGTSSVRRAVQLRAFRPDLEIVEIHGNIETRIGKLEGTGLDAIVLAKAGLDRLKLANVNGRTLSKRVMLPAVGQGCLALCILSNCDRRIKETVGSIDHPETRYSVLAERAFSRRLGGGCNVPIAALGSVSRSEKEARESSDKSSLWRLHLDGLVANNENSSVWRDTLFGPMKQAESIGEELARRLEHVLKS